VPAVRIFHGQGQAGAWPATSTCEAVWSRATFIDSLRVVRGKVGEGSLCNPSCTSPSFCQMELGGGGFGLGTEHKGSSVDWVAKAPLTYASNNVLHMLATRPPKTWSEADAPLVTDPPLRLLAPSVRTSSHTQRCIRTTVCAYVSTYLGAEMQNQVQGHRGGLRSCPGRSLPLHACPSPDELLSRYP